MYSTVCNRVLHPFRATMVVLQACHAQSASALVSSIFELRFENQASIRERCRVAGISPEARDMCESDWCVVSTRKEGAMHVSEV